MVRRATRVTNSVVNALWRCPGPSFASFACAVRADGTDEYERYFNSTGGQVNGSGRTH